jgi:outer membrane protein OmpA-like peptidoglycan-associated protein
MNIKWVAALLVGLATSMGPASAQVAVPNPTQTKVAPQVPGETPVYYVAVVGRTAPAVNYGHRRGATKVDFRGTTLLPDAHGEAKVESKRGYMEIEVEFDELVPAIKYGPEYLTYVMWAVTPEGRATNLGEVLLDGSESKLNVTTELQAFAMVVTAEPYFAVTQPSDAVVLENVVRSDTQGTVETVEARYELLKRGTYLMATDAASLPSKRPGRAPLELAEARNAVYFARIAGANEYAPETFGKAADLLVTAEQQNQRGERKALIGAAREAAQAAEDSRLVAIHRRDVEIAAKERQQMLEREADALRRADFESRQRADAESARMAAELGKAEAERTSERLAGERADAERRAQEASQFVAAAEGQRAELLEKLQQQLNKILETRESARGLIVNMSDVLFDTGSATLKSGSREKLARIAGVLLAYPSLHVAVEGHTDNVGEDAYNQSLSKRRAEAVRTYLVEQGIPQPTIEALGFGEARPVVDNTTPAGRQQNRRVELVISGVTMATPTERR